MKVHVLHAISESHQALVWVDSDKWSGNRTSIKAATAARRLAAKWTPPVAEWLSIAQFTASLRKKEAKRSKGDVVYVDPWLVVISLRARDLLAPTFERFGEFLPIKVASEPDSEYFVFHCTNVLDVLDRPRSAISPGDGRIMRYAFRRDLIPSECVFRVSKSDARVLITDAVVELFQRNRITGGNLRDAEVFYS
jgi:hypothetical protein